MRRPLLNCLLLIGLLTVTWAPAAQATHGLQQLFDREPLPCELVTVHEQDVTVEHNGREVLHVHTHRTCI